MEGIIFNDIFVDNEEEFIKLFEEYYAVNSKKINGAIMALSNFLNTVSAKTLTVENAKKFLSIWDQFEKQVLLNNQELQLMVGYRYSDGKKNTNVQYSGIISQKDAIINGKIDAGSKAVRRAIDIGQRYQDAKKVQDFLTAKSQEFIDILYNNLSDSEAKTLVLNQYNFVPDKWKGDPLEKVNQRKKYWGPFIGKKWQDIYFGDEGYYYRGQGLGKAYDAFMKHIANHHRQIFTYLISQGQNYNNVTNNLNLTTSHNAYLEEGGVSGNFPRLLYDATNNIAWYTGGDIVIIDPKTKAVVFNIQLKTTSIMNRDPTAFTIAIARLKTIVGGGTLVIGKQQYTLKALSQLSPREKAQQLYKYFKTSVSNYSEFQSIQNTLNHDINTTTDDLINLINS